MGSVRLVASDLDNTLLTGEGQLPPGFFNDIRGLNELGIVFVAASGRPQHSLRKLFPLPDADIAFISDNGGTVSYHGEILFQSLLPTDSYQEMVTRTMTETTGVPVVCGLDAAYVWAGHRRHEEALRAFQSSIVFVEDLAELTVLSDKYSAYFPDNTARHFHDAVFQPAYGADYSVAVGTPAWVDVMNAGVNKGHALGVLATHLGLGPEQLMAFGDTDNDLEMLASVHHSYAVSNADEAVHRVARFTADSNLDHGVTKVVRSLLANQGKAPRPTA